MPYDPHIYYNPDSPEIPLLDEYRNPLKQIDLTDNYEDWVEINLSLASLGEEGRNYFHEVSRLNAKYDYQQCDAKFSELLRNRTGRVTIGTFFKRCEETMGKTWERSGNEGRDNATEQPLTDWVLPLPLNTPLLSVLSVSHSMLPDTLKPWLVDVSNRMKCPLDFVASAAIVMLSSLVGTRLAIKPKAKDDWTITPNL